MGWVWNKSRRQRRRSGRRFQRLQAIQAGTPLHDLATSRDRLHRRLHSTRIPLTQKKSANEFCRLNAGPRSSRTFAPRPVREVGALIKDLFESAVDVVHVLTRAEKHRLLQPQGLLAAKEVAVRTPCGSRWDSNQSTSAETAYSAKEAQTNSLSLRAKMQRWAYAGGGQANFLPSYGDVGSKTAARPISSYAWPFKFARISSPRSV